MGCGKSELIIGELEIEIQERIIMVDLHTHILPKLDDGADSLEEALEMLELAIESGVDTIVATPHSNQRGRFENYNTEYFVGAYESFCRKVKKAELPIKILPGMEIFAAENIGFAIERGMLIGLNHSNYYLVEFPFDAEIWWIGERLEQILDKGKIPLIAHPERYSGVQEYPAVVWEWLQIGCYTQINKGSVLGKFGRRVQYAAENLLRNDLVTCVASDAHSPYMRTTYLGDIRKYLNDWLGESWTYRLLEKNPRRIINCEKIPKHGNMPEKRTWLFC